MSSTSLPSGCKVFVTQDDSVFVSTQGDPLPNKLPGRYEATEDLPRHWIPRDAFFLSWARNSHPHLAFIPMIRQPTGFIFDRISFTEIDAPIEFNGRGWVLQSEAKENLRRLESHLWNISQWIRPKEPLLFPVYFDPARDLPSTYNYNFSVTNKNAARQIAIHIRDAFFVLAGVCSLTIAQYTHVMKANPSWTELLLERGVQPAWVEEFKHSFVADWKLTRLGSLIDVRTCQWRQLIPGMVASNVPLWLYYGQLEELVSVNCPYLTPYRPNDRDIHKGLLRRKGHTWVDFGTDDIVEWPDMEDTPMKDHNPISSKTAAQPQQPPTSSRDDIKLPSGSRQLPGETWQEFLTRDAEYRERRLKTESPQDREARLNRERHPCVPGRNSKTRVWHWLDVDGFRVRTIVARKWVHDTLGNHSDKQCIYNSIRNEWDVCTEFDPDGQVDPDDYQWSPEKMRPQPENATPATHTADDTPASLPEPAWEKDIIENVDVEENPARHDCPSLSDIAAYRYGLDLGDLSFQDVSVSEDEWVRVTMHIREFDNRFERETHSSKFIPRAVILSFVTGLLKNEPNLVSTAWDLWDTDATFMKNSAVSIGRLGSMYTISPKHDPVDHAYLAVEDPLSALQIVRANPGTTYKELMAYFVRMGIPCRTLFSTDPTEVANALTRPTKPQSVRVATMGLGHRAAGYKGTYADYLRYVHHRDAALREPRARVALLKGGILWRLAKDSLSVDEVTSGSTNEFFDCAFILEDPCTGTTYTDDELTQQEMDFICGVYNVANDARGNPSANLSWWPKHAAWAASGLNVGYWSSDSEVWYQNRLNDIKTGKAKLKSATQWRETLHFRAETRKFKQIVKAASEAYLARHILQT